MQVVFKDEDERGNSGGTSAVGSLVCIERISRYMEGKCDGRIRNRGNGVRDGGGIFDSFKKGIQQRRGGIGKGGGVEKVRTRRKDNGGVYTRIQEGGKRKQV